MNKNLLACVAGILLGICSVASAQSYPFQDPSLPMTQRVKDLVSRMTLDEKIFQMMNAAPAIPRLGVPAYDYWSEGLHGIARSGYATMFPQAIGMAATWDPALVGKMAETIGIEARAKYNDAVQHDNHERYFGLTVWSPNINIFRDPRWGRGQETYGEDPYLTSRMGVAFVEGLQGNDPQHPLAIATPKHFAVHSGPESSRHRINITPSPYDLEDTYLPAFRATITEAHADSLMCAYNAVDGVPACANKMLLEDTLRKAWNFDGFVTSDCGAVDDFFMPDGHHYSPDAEHASASAVLAGTDTNCGDTYKVLAKAVDEKLLPVSAIDQAVTRLFTARFELGLFDGGTDGAGVGKFGTIGISEDDSEQHEALARQAARESMVLLKNEGDILPLSHNLRSIAVIGPNAASLTALEGNYNAIPAHPVLPIDGIADEFGGARITYAQGSPYAENVMLPAPRTLFHSESTGVVGGTARLKDGTPDYGLKGEYFDSPDFEGKPAFVRVDKQIDFDWDAAAPAADLRVDHFAVRWTGTITPPASGDYKFSFSLGDCYPCRDHEQINMYVDGKQVAHFDSHEPGDSRSANLPAFSVHFTDTRPHTLRVDYAHMSGLFGGGVTLNWIPPIAPLRAEAVAAAKDSDLVIAFVGLSSKLEGEEMPIHVEGFAGGDRTDIQLPAAQQQLLEAVAATGKPLVVVLMNGSALAVNWAQQHANAILEAWYPGEDGGTAIAETLSGKNNPGGKLPLTFYKSIDQLPPFDDYAMKGRTYRYFKGKPLYAFGDGLSYSTFSYSSPKLSSDRVHAGEPVRVEVTVRNTGKIAGDAVAELYLQPPASGLSPMIALKGFERLHLTPGQSQIVHFTLDPRDQSIVDSTGNRSVQPGHYSVFVGGSQPNEKSMADSKAFTVEGAENLPR